ncbi:MAG: LysO family transporter [Thermodesulfobacteriota bacterium]
MINVFLFLFAGILTGWCLKKRKKTLFFFDKSLMVSVFLLLFLFGVEAGTNEKVTGSFLKTGFSGILLAVGAVAGSIILIIPVYRLIFKDKAKEEKQ